MGLGRALGPKESCVPIVGPLHGGTGTHIFLHCPVEGSLTGFPSHYTHLCVILVLVLNFFVISLIPAAPHRRSMLADICGTVRNWFILSVLLLPSV